MAPGLYLLVANNKNLKKPVKPEAGAKPILRKQKTLWTSRKTKS